MLIDAAGGRKPLARRFGVTDSAIKSWLRGSRPVEGKLLTATKKSGVSLDWLKYGRGDTDDEISKVSPHAHYSSNRFVDHGSSRLNEDSPSHSEAEDGWPIVVRILAARLNSKQIAEAMKEILDEEDIGEPVSKSASQILISAQLPKLNR